MCLIAAVCIVCLLAKLLFCAIVCSGFSSCFVYIFVSQLSVFIYIQRFILWLIHVRHCFFNPYKPSVPFLGHWQIVQTQIVYCRHISTKFAAGIKENQEQLTTLYWLPKLHKRPYKVCFIANSKLSHLSAQSFPKCFNGNPPDFKFYLGKLNHKS